MYLPPFTADLSVYKPTALYWGSSTQVKDRAVGLSDYYPLPGSYQNSCYGCYIEGTELAAIMTCDCYDFYGNSFTSSVNVACGQDIANCDGYLSCGGC